MAKLGGENALIYIGLSTIVSERNAWSLDITRELREAKVFQAGAAGSSWVENSAGFKSWSGSFDGYYDNASEIIVTSSVDSAAEVAVTLYESRLGAGSLKYWYGTAFLDMSESISTDGYAELNATMTGTGALVRVSP